MEKCNTKSSESVMTVSFGHHSGLLIRPQWQWQPRHVHVTDAMPYHVWFGLTLGICVFSLELLSLESKPAKTLQSILEPQSFPKWRPAAISDLIEPEIVPFEPSTPKTLPKMKHEVDRITHCEDKAIQNLTYHARGVHLWTIFCGKGCRMGYQLYHSKDQWCKLKM